MGLTSGPLTTYYRIGEVEDIRKTDATSAVPDVAYFLVPAVESKQQTHKKITKSFVLSKGSKGVLDSETYQKFFLKISLVLFTACGLY